VREGACAAREYGWQVSQTIVADLTISRGNGATRWDWGAAEGNSTPRQPHSGERQQNRRRHDDDEEAGGSQDVIRVGHFGNPLRNELMDPIIGRSRDGVCQRLQNRGVVWRL